MKKPIILTTLFSLFLGVQSIFALAAYDTRITQRDPTNVTNLTRDLPLPPNSLNAVLGMNGGSKLPQYMILGQNLSFDGVNINVTGLQTANIIDTTIIGKIIMTSNTPADVRASIGAGTSNFSGSYLDLTDLPAFGSAALANTSDFATAAQGLKADSAVQPASLATDLATKVDKIVGKGLSTEDFTSAEKTKLSGIATGATANSTDAYLLNRSNHTGTQLASTISDFAIAASSAVTWSNLSGKPTLSTVATSGDYNDLSNKPTIPSAQVKSDWTASSGISEILNKPTLSTVATTGSYNDLSNKPTIPSSQVNSDWNAVSGVSQILNKPTLATVSTTGSYNDLSNKPTLSTVSSTGDYNDLLNKPTIPSSQVNSDWNSSSGLSQILNKPTLSTVATTGAYSDLSGKPTLSTVSSTGSYNDLLNKPTIPAAQINSDWNAVSGLSQILNKPTLSTVATSGSYNDLSNKPTIPVINARVFNNNVTRSLVSSATSTGFQISSTRDAHVSYTVVVTAATQIGLVASVKGQVVLEICPTNSTTATDWVRVGPRGTTGQTIGLAIALSLNQEGSVTVNGMIPAGYYVRLRTININGTPTYTYDGGQEVLD